MKTFLMIAAALPLALATVPVHAAPADDGFLTEAMQGDNSEVAIGKLAQTNAGSARVRSYGEMLVMDHGAHRQKLGAMAQTMGGMPTDALSPDGAQARDMLSGMKGAEFDHAFRQHMIEDHQKDIAKYEHEAKTATSPAVRKMAMQTLPTLRKHLAAARALPQG